ncbi:cysteine desulfurase [Paenibacillus sp. alder61]|uniref:cysteine desulfurase n=1 Tax=Paenibacillus faecis TaxID=862114 RepID=A0A5D0CS74_9BACL|nr:MULTISPECIES: cysteine desulfurase family protein [Paenibacillus]MCA1293558.1 cysteine desulfurase [Paenibacillus sp. alder61]TYA12683.1 cysteine desulfurase [Paenibacillus faecis]
MKTIYLDHAASTPVHPEVAEAMVTVMREQYGNASSIHAYGRAAKRLVNGSRDRLAALVGCRPDELVFTSGGTESDNLALFGAAEARKDRGRHIITTAIEHHAVLHACGRLEKQGYEVTYLPVDRQGQVHPEQVREAIRPDTILISVMYANNEVGTIQPIEEIGALAAEKGIVFHVDAVQALGALEIRLGELPVDLMSFSAHKINGPQGVGALYVSRELVIEPILFGGLQERKRRAGTENMAGIAGFAKAAELAAQQLPGRAARDEELRRIFLDALETEVGAGRFHVNGHPTRRLAHIVNVSFPECDTETMLMNLDMEGIAVASGSACSSGSLEPSHVLEAMNLPINFLNSAIRFSFGLGNTTEEMKLTAEKVGTILNRLRKRR